MSIKTASLGFSRIGKNRELKFALEKFWAGKIDFLAVEEIGKNIRKSNWELQSKLDYIPSGDFSYYDHILDLSFEFNNIPSRFDQIQDKTEKYFAVARGYQKNGLDLHALELSKWLGTNYHYIIPEFHSDVYIQYKPYKFVKHFLEAKALGHNTRPVILGPVSYILLGKNKTASGFDVFPQLLQAYKDLLKDLKNNGATDIQIDEPILGTQINDTIKNIYEEAYFALSFCGLNIHLATYFDELLENTNFAFSLPVQSIHLDVSENNLPKLPKTEKIISLGIVNGRNIWKNNYDRSFEILKNFTKNDNLIISTSCSLLHVPYSVENELGIDEKVRNRLAFAKEKIDELLKIKNAFVDGKTIKNEEFYIEKNTKVWEKLNTIGENFSRKSDFLTRKEAQKSLNIPLFPTTTIGSFPQSDEIRKNRSDFKQGVKTLEEYEAYCRGVIKDCIAKQEEIGIDVLVHGECERNDMVEYFGENFDGFCFTKNGWVQSYGSRCVKPPVIYGDVSRPKPITVEWAKYAQSCTKKHVKGMLTGPVTILKWSFVRDDIPQELTCKQIAIALLDEVLDLESAGIKIIQIDEPAIREILPIRKSKWNEILTWAVDSFKLSCRDVQNETQIHTHICYSEFNEIISHIINLDADVISIESSRSDLDVLNALQNNNYKNDIGPGVWDIHSPRIPTVDEMQTVIEKSLKILKPEQIWINPDCGLKTRKWDETVKSLKNMVQVAKNLRK